MLTKDERTILVFAFRYALPRHTYALSLVFDQLKQHIDDFESWELTSMIFDVSSYYPSDDFGSSDQEFADRVREYLRNELTKRDKDERY